MTKEYFFVIISNINVGVYLICPHCKNVAIKFIGLPYPMILYCLTHKIWIQQTSVVAWEHLGLKHTLSKLFKEVYADKLHNIFSDDIKLFRRK